MLARMITHLAETKLTAYRFGWVNASFVYGLQFLNSHMRRALGTITPYETFSSATALQTPPEEPPL
jgi:hypothetical protein